MFNASNRIGMVTEAASPTAPVGKLACFLRRTMVSVLPSLGIGLPVNGIVTGPEGNVIVT